jgi:hypothetical protein
VKRAALVAGVALLASSCGASKPAPNAADVAPRSTYALLGGDSVRVREALELLPEGPRLVALLARARALTGSSAPARVAVLDPAGTRAVAFARPQDRAKLEHALEDAGIAHARVRGWVAFSRSRAAVDEVRHAKHHLDEARWFEEPPAGADASFVLRSLTVTADARADTVTVRRTTPASGGPADAEHPLAARIPGDALAAAAVHGGAAELERLGLAAPVESGLGLRSSTLEELAPGDAVVFARPAEPVPQVTLLAAGSRAGAAARTLRELAPPAATLAPTALDGVPLRVVALGAVDLVGGAFDGTTVVTDDPGVKLRSKVTPLRPDGLPAQTSAWAYLDVAGGLPALESLAALAGTHLTPGFVRRVAPFRSVLVYRTGSAGHETLVVVGRERR